MLKVLKVIASVAMCLFLGFCGLVAYNMKLPPSTVATTSSKAQTDPMRQYRERAVRDQLSRLTDLQGRFSAFCDHPRSYTPHGCEAVIRRKVDKATVDFRKISARAIDDQTIFVELMAAAKDIEQGLAGGLDQVRSQQFGASYQ